MSNFKAGSPKTKQILPCLLKTCSRSAMSSVALTMPRSSCYEEAQTAGRDAGELSHQVISVQAPAPNIHVIPRCSNLPNQGT